MGVVQRMGLVTTDGDDKPRSPLRIHKATPFRGPPPPLEEQQKQIEGNATFGLLTEGPDSGMPEQ